MCVSDRTPPERKWWNVTLELCKVNTCLISMFTEWDLVTDYTGKDIGFSDKKRVPSDTGVALEVWTGVGSDDTCEVPLNDDVLSAGSATLPYGYFVIPVVKEAQLGDIEIGASAATFTLTGITAPGAKWGRGPYNVVATDASNTAGRLQEAFKADQHLRVLRTTIAPPAASDDCCALTLPTPYYGATAIGVAPAQPACGTGVNEVQRVTVTGGPTGGTFTLTKDGQATSGLAPNVSGAAMQTALAALSTIGAGNVSVTGSGPWDVTFQGALAGTNVGQMTAAHTFTGGTTPNVAVTTTTQGG